MKVIRISHEKERKGHYFFVFYIMSSAIHVFCRCLCHSRASKRSSVSREPKIQDCKLNVHNIKNPGRKSKRETRKLRELKSTNVHQSHQAYSFILIVKILRIYDARVLNLATLILAAALTAIFRRNNTRLAMKGTDRRGYRSSGVE